jgi:hypothetical protein
MSSYCRLFGAYVLSVGRGPAVLATWPAYGMQRLREGIMMSNPRRLFGANGLSVRGRDPVLKGPITARKTTDERLAEYFKNAQCVQRLSSKIFFVLAGLRFVGVRVGSFR